MSEKDNVKEIDRNEEDRRKTGEGKEEERKHGEGTKIVRERELKVLMAHKLIKLLQIIFLSCADSSMPSSR